MINSITSSGRDMLSRAVGLDLSQQTTDYRNTLEAALDFKRFPTDNNKVYWIQRSLEILQDVLKASTV